tara:strand:- start:1519 stop:1929 length:411 start_codon:yes stop_codon:yes gene_type:complete
MTKKNLFLIIIILIGFDFFQSNSFSVEPEEILENHRQEQRARKISKKIRCMVCQNQSIDESDAPLAKDLRILIRSKIKDGYSDKEIFIFLTDRYGDFILLKPPFKAATLALWILPFIFLIIGILLIYLHNKRSKKI